MERHRPDGWSFAIGTVLVVLGIAGATASLGRVRGDGARIAPVLLVLLAVALLLGLHRPAPAERSGPTEPDHT